MWVLIVFMVMQTPQGPVMRAGAVPGQYATLEECQVAQLEFVREHGEPDAGVGLGCSRIPSGARDA